MEASKAFEPLQIYDVWLIIIGVALLATTVLPRLLTKVPISHPAILLGAGLLVALAGAPLGLGAPDPFAHGKLIEHVTELGVIVALMGAGLRIDRAPSLRGWGSTWRLLGITMVLSIGLAAATGFWLAGLVPATAMLFGAVIAPTDPVLASEVQVGAPMAGSVEAEIEEYDPEEHGEEDDVRLTLTAEAGLNDGLAFPFTNMAIAMAMVGAHPSHWIETWLLVDVLAKMAIGVVVGLALGHVLARVLLSVEAETRLAKAMVGLGALAATLIVYGGTELFGGYGFIATFIGAVIVRNHERKHEYHHFLFMFSEKVERILTALILLGLAAAVAHGLLAPLSWPLVATAILVVFVIRPLAGVVGLIGVAAPWRERLAISFFGVRGIGSLYYLAYALNKTGFEGAAELWAVVALVIMISVIVHGVSATPVMNWLDAARHRGPPSSSQAKPFSSSR